jgi:hypothetical protein
MKNIVEMMMIMMMGLNSGGACHAYFQPMDISELQNFGCFSNWVAQFITAPYSSWSQIYEPLNEISGFKV